MNHEFWVSSGHLFLDHDSEGYLRVTDDFLRAYLARPELLPPDDACDHELALHRRLMHDPFAPIDPAGLVDPDAYENWLHFKRLRDVLVAAPNLEAGYLRLIGTAVPPLMLDQLVHLILRNALHGSHDPMMVRAAKSFFREQRVATYGGRTLVADAEVVDQAEAARERSPLLSMLAGPAVSELEIISEENAATYWAQIDAYDLVMDLEDFRPALARVMRVWLAHMLWLQAAIEPVPRIEDPDWRWFVGLDETATRIGNALWHGTASEADNLLGLFRLSLPHAQRPVWLMLAGDAGGRIRIKPQNLLFGLPER